MYRLLVFIGLFLSTLHYSHGDDLKKILRLLEKGKLEKALDVIEESLDAETINPGSKWIYAELLSTDSLEIYNLDSARRYIDQALMDYDSIGEKELGKLGKLGIVKAHLLETSLKIENLTFQFFIVQNQIKGFNNFMRIYPGSVHKDLAIKKRDSLAFNDVRSVHTWQAYKDYLDTYPNSEYYDEAQTQYDLLLFQNRTSTGKLADYRKFVAEHPNSPFIEESLNYIFTYSTLDHDVNSLVRFIKDYPQARDSRKAANILVYLDEQSVLHYRDLLTDTFIDSLLISKNSTQDPLVPALDQEKVGFRDFTGKWVVPPTFSAIDPEMFCRIFNQDYVWGVNEDQFFVLNRKGEKFYQGHFQQLVEIGLGTLLLLDSISGSLVHKSGFEIISNVTEAGVFANRWLKVKRGGKWALVSFSGVQLTDFRFDEIYDRGNFFVFRRDTEIALTHLTGLLSELGEGGITLEYKYDDLEFVNDSLAIGFKGDRECLVDDQLNFRIPWSNHTVYPDPNVFYTKEGNNYRIYESKNFFLNLTSEEISSSPYWLIIKQDSSWQAINLETKKSLSSLDSTKLITDFALFVQQNDSSYCLFPNGQKILIEEDMRPFTLRTENESLLAIEQEDLISVWNRNGTFYFQGFFEQVDVLTDSLFRVKYRDKYGLVDHTGYYLLEPDYDFIQLKDDLVMLLTDQEIGLYDLSNDVFIEPEFDAAFTKVAHLYKTRSDGYFGLLNDDGSTALPFEYVEIEPFSQNRAWLKTDTSWYVVDLFSKNRLPKSYVDKQAIETSQGTYFRILTAKGYGIMSPDGEIINTNFSDIRLIGDDPQYFMAEHYVPEAGLYVIVAYDLLGNQIYSQALKEEEYDQIYCE